MVLRMARPFRLKPIEAHGVLKHNPLDQTLRNAWAASFEKSDSCFSGLCFIALISM
jgi:hypothetical protein